MKGGPSLRGMLATAAALLIVSVSAVSGSKVTVHGIYMTPYGNQAESSSRAGGGIGGRFLMTLPAEKPVMSWGVGLEYVNLLSQSVDGGASIEGVYLPYTRETDQWYGRLSVGMQAGGFGNGFFRPYAAFNLALVTYAINTSLTFYPSTGEEFSEAVYDDIDAVFGLDMTLGMDFNIWKEVSIDGGVKYLKSFSVPDQLGGEAVKLYPQYFQVFLGVGFNVLDEGLE